MPKTKRQSVAISEAQAQAVHSASERIKPAPEYALTLFIGAFLLFQLQPLIGKYILPWFGGGPGVWTTCMLFFQVLLLAGYAYVHLVSRCSKIRTQVIIHFGLLFIALLFLQIIPSDRWKPNATGNPIVQILFLLAANIGLPYLVLASTSPLLQHWFSRLHPESSPYRLYSLSNIGSLLALVSYPFFFETHFNRKSQGVFWSCGFIAYAFGVVICAFKIWKRTNDGNPKLSGNSKEQSIVSLSSSIRPSLFARTLWLALAACASTILLATTNKLCLDIAVVPFLWIIPLALYLLSFVICFDHPRWYRRLYWTVAAVIVLTIFCYSLQQRDWPISKLIAVYSATFFVLCMICHGELFRLRPDPRHLTEFYLLIATGGALGGVFAAMIAPIIFTGYYELQIGILICALLFLAVCLRDSRHTQKSACVCLAVGIIVLGVTLWIQREKFGDRMIATSRNFYGVLRVFDHSEGEIPEHILWVSHGQTLHGAQFVGTEKCSLPTIYYGEDSGVGLAMRALQTNNRRVGLVGLGAGTLVTYSRPGDFFHIYEINPEMLRIARTEFRFLSNNQATLEFSLGDGRLSLEREPPQNFDLLALDAFSSDAIPVHLLTVEAFEIYRRHMKTNGIIAVHISNKWLDLEPVLANVAKHFQYRVSVVDHVPPPEQWWLRHSMWVLLAEDGQVFNSSMLRDAGRAPAGNSDAIPLWTDDFASLFPILR
jgi:uncharacterized membrane protein YciS (DUF1049 family)